MNLWRSFRELFAIRPSLDENGSAVSDEFARALSDDRRRAERWQKIRFDNTIRLYISIPSLLACVVLWVNGALPKMGTVAGTFLVYGGVQLATNIGASRSLRPEAWEYVLCALDVWATAVGVSVTGGATSPLCFIFFIPLLLQAFHRDWILVLSYGVGGAVCFAAASLATSAGNSAALTDIIIRVLFMGLTIGISCLALHLLRRRDEDNRYRIERLRALAAITERLNRMCVASEATDAARDVASLMDRAIGKRTAAWSRILLADEASGFLVQAASRNERAGAKPDIAPGTCPSMREARPFEVTDGAAASGCPVESFGPGSHLCLPIAGSERDPFGVLFVHSERPNAFHDAEREFLQFVATSIGLALQRVQRMAELRKAVEINTCVVAAMISSVRSVDETAASLLESVESLVGCDQSALFVWSGAAEALKARMVRGMHAGEEWDRLISSGEGFVGRAFETGKVETSSQRDADPVERRSRARAIVALPLMTLRGETIGVLTVTRFEDRRPFGPQDIHTASVFASRAALALENAALYDRLRAASPPQSGDWRRAA